MSVVEYPRSMDRRAIKQRLWNPPNGRASEESEVISPIVALRQKQADEAHERQLTELRQQLSELHQRLRSREYELVIVRGKLATAEHELQRHRQKEQVLEAVIQGEPPPTENLVVRVPLKHILETVADHFALPVGGLFSKRRTPQHLVARQIAYYLANDDDIGGMALAAIGRRMDRDHTTVLHSVRKIERAVISGENEIAGHVAELTKKVRQPA